MEANLTPEVYPRVGGGNLGNASKLPISKGLSPRGRGKLAMSAIVGGVPRSIPAWAGETRDAAPPICPI